jgi:hypothetical protein
MAVPVGEQPEMPDADESSRKNVEQEATQELVRRYSHDLLLAAVGVVSPAEGDTAVVKGDEAMVRDGNAVGVSSQIAENVF